MRKLIIPLLLLLTSCMPNPDAPPLPSDIYGTLPVAGVGLLVIGVFVLIMVFGKYLLDKYTDWGLDWSTYILLVVVIAMIGSIVYFFSIVIGNAILKNTIG